MKIVVTGSLGHISKPLAAILLQQSHEVIVISSNPAKQKEIEAMGAKAAIGSIYDTGFLAQTLAAADAVYCMNPPDFTAADQVEYYENTAKVYAAAIQKSRIKRVLYLSSYGAHLPSGTGFITGSYKSEKILDAIPDIQLTHIRPAFFYYNLFGFIKMIKAAGFIGAVYGGDDKLAMVAPLDIAVAVAEEIAKTENIARVRYVASDDKTCNEAAEILGKAIGIPALQWLALPKEKVMQSLLQNGIPENAAANLVELGEATHSGILREDYALHKPVLGKVKLEAFAKEFAIAYNAA